MKAGIRKTIDGLKSYMTKHGYTGLFVPGECGCEISDIAPCGEDFSECELGYVIDCAPEEEKEGYNFMVTNKKPNSK